MSDIKPVSQYAYHNQIGDSQSVPYGSVPIGDGYELEVVSADRVDVVEAFQPGAKHRPTDLTHLEDED